VNHSAGRQAALIEALWWPTLWVLSAVFVIVIAALCYGVWRRRPANEVIGESSVARWVGVSIGITVVILFAFYLGDLFTARALADIPRDRPVTITLTGHQWWWEARYEDTIPERKFTTANELHIPVGVPIRIVTTSADVIHSFWVPALHGKRDLLTGDRNEFWIRADSAGVYQGQCAEYCGMQHAMMGLLVIAEPDSAYRAWTEHQRLAATLPDSLRTSQDSLIAAGYRVFGTKACVMCHSVRGTIAGSSVGPDLTHLASRRTLAAGTVPNTRGNLAGWIVDPQGIKPGTLMPPNQLTPTELASLIAFLESLK
jgi:cytochrome c oxidase subunit 2